MKKLSNYITEKLKINNSTKRVIPNYKIDEIVDGIIDALSYELNDEAEGMVIKGEDLYVRKDLRIGIDPSTGEWEIGEKKDIEKNYDLIFNPEELTYSEHSVFVTDDLERKIKAAF